MASVEQIRQRVSDYLAASLDLDDFEDWFLSHNWNAHLYADAKAIAVVNQIEGLLLDFSADAVNEERFRQELTRIVHTFVLVKYAFGVDSESENLVVSLGRPEELVSREVWRAAPQVPYLDLTFPQQTAA